ncbi:cbb3-type cytochrome oxidase assembly protein CcoS [Halpernia frigidisoli]|uniref:Cytochrome oxidase maturation protein, cbb3-type n=1 Tax=Halpernia frigidisoli TaxID=1125876 RepID=A0A1I3I319_9FLAO|nr:cbb3-type cytochrome oxidase assembly protein CcoS [Halpernia frigidisoli]SFI42405.1 cytochrome oxidase maturation protein, cbb3-type [Halpernia frigidisoli]
MDILYLMIICSVSVAAVFLIIFIIGAKNGQFEDDESPAVRILMDNEVIKENPKLTEEKPSDLDKKEKK